MFRLTHVHLLKILGIIHFSESYFLFEFFYVSVDSDRLELVQVYDTSKLESHGLVTLLPEVFNPLFHQPTIFDQLDVLLTVLPESQKNKTINITNSAVQQKQRNVFILTP